MRTLMATLLLVVSTSLMADVYIDEYPTTEYVYPSTTVVEEYYNPYSTREVIEYNPNVTIRREYIVTPLPRVIIRRPTVIYQPDYYRW
jgi:hypothetical protein